MHVTQEQLLEAFIYDDGKLIWRELNSDTTLSKNYKRHNTLFAGKVFGKINKYGYVRAGFLGKTLSVHRMVFLYHKGYLPEFIDHIDGVRNNNRIENLRPATKSQNSWNRRINGAWRSSKFKGAVYHKASGKWTSNIRKHGRNIYLGLFNSPEEAHAAYCKASEELHGTFSKPDTC